MTFHTTSGGPLQDFKELRVWQKAHELTLGVYRATQRTRRGEFPGLVPQLRRAAGSIPANIAEGCGHAGPRELARFLQIAMASAAELEYHLILAADLRALQRSTYDDLMSRTKEVKRMLTSLIQRVRDADVVDRRERRQRSVPPPTTDD